MLPSASGTLWAGLTPVLASAGLAMLVGFGLGRVTAPPAAIEQKSDRVMPSSAKEAENQEPAWQTVETGVKTSTAADVAGAAAMGSPRQREKALEEVLAKASLEEVRKSLDWANALPDGPMKKAALEKILKRWGQLDGPGATAYASQVYAETGNPSLLREALSGWADKDPQAAVNQLAAMNLNDGLQQDIRRDLLEQWADLSPTAAAAYAAANRNPDSWRGLVGTVADEWSKRDPAAAANWAAALDAGRDKRAAIYTAISNWADADLNGAAAYVSGQPAGESRDTMAGTLARHIGQEDPASGLKWAAMVADPGSQERAIAGALIDLYRKDEAQARQLLQSSTISAQVQAAALSRMTNRGPWWR
ncbi:MAG: hypothetical protein FJ411_05515 [Verrucomicrobia bacterium]|nr:hypothetical protein [Verrucomicrobiota bacterium]